MRSTWPDIDTSTPVLVFRAEDYGALNAIRSLGRLGVRVFGLDRSESSPAMRSRYLSGRFLWDVEQESPDATVELLREAAREIGGRPILLHTGDTTALFLSDHADELTDLYTFPVQPAGLVERLHDKRALHDLCRSFGVPTAETLFPESVDELPGFLDRVRFPLMLKGIHGQRLEARTGLRMQIVRDRDELMRAYERLDEPGHPNLMLQEYIPGDDTTVWMYEGYFDGSSECLFGITGQKLRQHPVHVGMTSLGVCRPNGTVEANTRRLARAAGYRGIIDIGHRYDERTGEYKVLDVNPRVGVTFRLFVDASGLDVVRALYLDLTGQSVPGAQPIWGRKWFVEDKDLISSWNYRREGTLGVVAWLRSFQRVEESAYFASDDVAPAAAMVAGWGRRAAGGAWRRASHLLQRRREARAPGPSPPVDGPGLRTLLHKASHYAGAGLAGMLAAAISYPLFTRLLDVEDYGAMGLIQVILLAGVAAAKLGLQNSVVRLWSAHEGTEVDRQRFASTFFYAALGLGAAATLLCLAADLLLRGVLPGRLLWPLALASLLIPTRALSSFAQSFMRAREESRRYALVSTGTALLGPLLAVTLVVWLVPPEKRLGGLYLGLLAGEALVLVLALRWAFARTRPRLARFDWGLTRAALRFGLPLLVFEAASLVLLMGDRVVIQLFLSERELGYYTAAYSLVWQLAVLFARPIEMAVVPMFTNAFERQGPRAASAIVTRIGRLYALAAAPMIAGLWAVREDLIIVLASHKYRAAQDLLPLLLAGFLIFGARVYVGAGLFLAKRSRLTAACAAGAALLNVILNLLLVPRFGITGSAVATGLSSLGLVVVIGILGHRHLPFELGLGHIAMYAIAAGVMAVLVSHVTVVAPGDDSFRAHLLQLMVRVALGLAIYSAFAVISDPAARALLGRKLRRQPAL